MFLIFLALFSGIAVTESIHLDAAKHEIEGLQLDLRNDQQALEELSAVATNLKKDNDTMVNVLKVYQSDPEFRKRVKAIKVPCYRIPPCKINQNN